MSFLRSGARATRSLLVDALQAYGQLLKVMVPALLIVKALDLLGGIDALGALLSPLMGLLGLPDWTGVVWAATLATNLLTGMVLIVELADGEALSVAQTTVLGALMLIGHSLPVEGAVAKRVGVPWRLTIALRVGGALVLAGLLHVVHAGFGWFQEPARLVWQPGARDDTAIGWLRSQLEALVTIFLVILALMALLRLLRGLGIERWIHLALVPVLRLLGIDRSAANVTVIGVVLGLSYGAGLLIRDVDAGRLSRRDGTLAFCFLGLAHSMIEDTLLILALGADLSGILWARLAFAFAVTALLSRWIPRDGPVLRPRATVRACPPASRLGAGAASRRPSRQLPGTGRR